jgi:hypothetical protein
VSERELLVEALRQTWSFPDDVRDDCDFSSYRGDWIATAAIQALRNQMDAVIGFLRSHHEDGLAEDILNGNHVKEG